MYNNYYKVKSYAYYLGLNLDNEQLKVIGRKLAKIARAEGEEIVETNDGFLRNVKCYHRDFLKRHTDLFTNFEKGDLV